MMEEMYRPAAGIWRQRRRAWHLGQTTKEMPLAGCMKLWQSYRQNNQPAVEIQGNEISSKRQQRCDQPLQTVCRIAYYSSSCERSSTAAQQTSVFRTAGGRVVVEDNHHLAANTQVNDTLSNSKPTQQVDDTVGRGSSFGMSVILLSFYQY